MLLIRSHHQLRCLRNGALSTGLFAMFCDDLLVREDLQLHKGSVFWVHCTNTFGVSLINQRSAPALCGICQNKMAKQKR